MKSDLASDFYQLDEKRDASLGGICFYTRRPKLAIKAYARRMLKTIK
jgi:hypothetical protein